jgi:hypothetical protein
MVDDIWCDETFQHIGVVVGDRLDDPSVDVLWLCFGAHNHSLSDAGRCRANLSGHFFADKPPRATQGSADAPDTLFGTTAQALVVKKKRSQIRAVPAAPSEFE